MRLGPGVRAGVVLGYQHRCRGRKGAACKHVEDHPDASQRRCPTHGILLWPKPRVRPVRWHDLRHSTASLLALVQVPLGEAQRILRHSDPKITAGVYTHVEREKLREAVNRMPISVGHLAPDVDEMWTAEVPGNPGQKKSPGEPGLSRSGKRDLNPRPSPWQGDALPLSYSRTGRLPRLLPTAPPGGQGSQASADPPPPPRRASICRKPRK